MFASTLIPRPFVLAAAVAGAAATLAAQRTWIVDIANGAGAHFTNLPAAVDAAADGDTLRVRPGTYFAVSTGKALTILGDNATFDSVSGTFDVANLPAGRDFVLRGFRFTGWPDQLRVRNCRGRVLLDSLSFTPFPSTVTMGPAIVVDGCDLVTLQGVVATGSPALACNASTVHVNGSNLTGSAAALSPIRFFSQPGMRITGGRAEVTQTQMTGGNGLSGGGLNFLFPSPGLLAENADLRVAGRFTSLRAGGGALSASGLYGTGGTLRLDPAVTVTPFGSAPAIGGTISVRTLPLPALSAFGASLGGNVTVDLYAGAGDAAAMVLGPPADLLPLPQFGGALGVDPARMVVVTTATVGTGGRLTTTLPIPNNEALRGSNWVWQALAGNPTAGFVLSNRAQYAIP